jgi:hypothetical protein
VLHASAYGSSHRRLMLDQPPAWPIDRIRADNEHSIYSSERRFQSRRIFEVRLAHNQAPRSQVHQFFRLAGAGDNPTAAFLQKEFDNSPTQVSGSSRHK